MPQLPFTDEEKELLLAQQQKEPAAAEINPEDLPNDLRPAEPKPQATTQTVEPESRFGEQEEAANHDMIMNQLQIGQQGMEQAAGFHDRKYENPSSQKIYQNLIAQRQDQQKTRTAMEDRLRERARQARRDPIEEENLQLKNQAAKQEVEFNAKKFPVEVKALQAKVASEEDDQKQVSPEIKSLLTKITKDPQWQNSQMTYAQLKNAAPFAGILGDIEKAGISAKSKSEAQMTRDSEKASRHLQRQAELYEKKRTDIKKGYDASDQVDSLLDQGNLRAASASFVQLARASGDTGALSNQDINRYGLDASLEGKTFDQATQFLTGQPSDRAIHQLKGITKIYKERSLKNLARERENYVSRSTQGGFAVPREEAEAYFGEEPLIQKSQVKVRNQAGETLLIDSKDLQAAQKDGYEQVN